MEPSQKHHVVVDIDDDDDDNVEKSSQHQQSDDEDLENSSNGITGNTANYKISQGAAVGSQMGVPEQNLRNGHMPYEEGRNKLMGMMTDNLSTSACTAFCNAS